MRQIRTIFWRVVALAILSAGAYALWVRFTQGLGAATNLTDRNPWGLWIGFDILCGVGLAAGGFTITTAVYILHLERLRPIVRPAVLTAFLGYLLVIVALMVDLGRPWNIWRAMVWWNPHSVMFEVAWCVMLYTTVLALEFSPVFFERMKWYGAARAVRVAVVPLVGLGCILSTLHQSSLGSLYLILPTKLHPLWYSPWLPVLFWISAVGAGLAMVIFESGMSARAFGRALEFDILQSVGRAMVLFLGAFLTVRFFDLGARGSLPLAFQLTGPGAYEARLFWLETLLMAAPMALAAWSKVRAHPQALFACATTVVAGFLVNRMNVATAALDATTGHSYFPSWMEIAVTLSVVVIGLNIFRFAVRFLPVYHSPAHVEVKERKTEPAVYAEPS